jgi:hypothetical protein
MDFVPWEHNTRKWQQVKPDPIGLPNYPVNVIISRKVGWRVNGVVGLAIMQFKGEMGSGLSAAGSCVKYLSYANIKCYFKYALQKRASTC